MKVSSSCTNCAGRGFMINNPCQECYGSGTTKKRRDINVTIPSGIHSGNVLKLSGMGNKEATAEIFGDAFIEIFIKEHPKFHRKDNDIHSNVTISYGEAVLGSKITVGGLRSPIPIIINPGTQSGTIIDIKSEGLPTSIDSSLRGSHRVHVSIEVPSKVSKEEEELIEKLEAMRLKKKLTD